MKFGIIQLMNGLFYLGNGTSTGNKIIQANNGDANPPQIRYNETSNKWEFAHDGSTFTEFGSGLTKGTATDIATGTDDAKYITPLAINDAGLKRWNIITGYTATPASTSTLTMTSDKTATLKVGMPVRYTISSVVYYGIITASASNLLTIAGASMGGDVTKLEYGSAEMVILERFFSSGAYADGTTTTLLATDMNEYRVWEQGKAYCVGFGITQKSADSGTEPKVNFTVNSAVISTNDTNNGLQVSATAGTWTRTGIDINTTNYDINRLEVMEISVTVAGGSADAKELSLVAIFVME